MGAGTCADLLLSEPSSALWTLCLHLHSNCWAEAWSNSEEGYALPAPLGWNQNSCPDLHLQLLHFHSTHRSSAA